MATNGVAIAALLTDDPDYGIRFAAAFGRHAAQLDREEILVAAAKALAAYIETLVSRRSAFDHFRDALARGDMAAADFPEAARRGLKLFIGNGRCFLCQYGPSFSNGRPDTARDSATGYLVLQPRNFGNSSTAPESYADPEMLHCKIHCSRSRAKSLFPYVQRKIQRRGPPS